MTPWLRIAGWVTALAIPAIACTPAPTPEPSQLQAPPRPEPTETRRSEQGGRHAPQKRACVEAAATTDPRAAGVVKAFCSDVINAGVPGAALVLRTPEGGRIALTHGVRCNGAPDPVTLETRFRLASLTKPLTALLVLRLAEAEALHLDDPLGRHLPELRGSAWADVKLEQLLTHTAGLPEQGAVIAALAGTGTDGDWIDALGRLPADAGAGRDAFRYSNLGYDLLGEVVARVDQPGWAAALQTEILDPLELVHTIPDASSADSAAACGHLAPTSAGIPIGADASLTHGDHAWKRPSGAALGSVLDLERLALAVTAAKADDDDALARALARSRQGERPAAHGQVQTLAWRRLPGEGPAVYRHTGALGHFTAELYFSQDGAFVLAYVANARQELRGTVAAALQAFTGATLVE